MNLTETQQAINYQRCAANAREMAETCAACYSFASTEHRRALILSRYHFYSSVARRSAANARMVLNRSQSA